MNFFKKLFCKSECRVIESLDSNQVLAQILEKAVEDGSLKGYLEVEKFIQKYHGVNLNEKFLQLKYVARTSEIDSLSKIWKCRSYKCTDVELSTWMK